MHLFSILRKSYQTVIALTAVLFLASCISTHPVLTHSYPKNSLPEFWIEYDPYPDLTGLSSSVRPVPMYEGWTDERMQRDLQRIHFSGFRGILISVRPQDIAREHIRSRCRRFYEIAEKVSPDLRLGLLFTAGSGRKLSMPLQNVMNFFQHQKFGESANALRLGGKPVLFLDSSMNTTGEYNGRQTYRRIGTEWPVYSVMGRVPPSSRPDGFTWVTAASNGGDSFAQPGMFRKWPVPRGNGRELFRGIQQAVNQKAAIICVHSWNNYQDGSFIEENTYDTTAMMWTMRHITEDLKKNSVPPKAEPGSGN